MDMKHESSGAVKIQEENKWVWPRWVKTALGSCEIWSNQVKGEPLMERAADGGQTARLKCEDQLSLEETDSSFPLSHLQIRFAKKKSHTHPLLSNLALIPYTLLCFRLSRFLIR
ncbi:hypothetical protein YC2023_024238 [Brassica napus]